MSVSSDFLNEYGCLLQSAALRGTGYRAAGIWVTVDEYNKINPQHIPERVIYNGTTTIAIFPDGKKVKARPDKGAVFDKETGLAMCVAKHVFGTRSKFLKAIEKANDQNEKEQDA